MAEYPHNLEGFHTFSGGDRRISCASFLLLWCVFCWFDSNRSGIFEGEVGGVVAQRCTGNLQLCSSVPTVDG